MPKKTRTTPPETEADTIRRLLSRKAGADLPTLQTATGWQPHSVRAALSGLRKAGYTIDRLPAKAGGTGGAYRIIAGPGNA